MENVIDRLLHDFEKGRLTRRQLVQSLAMAALAAPAAALAPGRAAASTEAAPWKTARLDHISYQVADHRRSAAFYADLMGWTVENQNERQTSMRIGDDLGTIIIRNRPADAPQAAPRGDRPPLTGVINHVSWGVTPWDTEAVRAELARRGLNPREDFQGDDFRSFHVLDPDGWDLQISNQVD